MANVNPDFQSRYLRGDFESLFSLPVDALEAALKLPRESDRHNLTAALRRYAERFEAPDRVFKQVDLLAQDNTRAVVTGQQAGLMLGPMYSLSKAITAIALAEQLSSEEQPVVAIFWVASQDADSAEINHSYLLDLDEQLHRLSLPLADDVPAGRIRLQPEWLTTLQQALQQGHWSDHGKAEVLELLEHSFSQSTTMADWFSAILYKLLGDKGLIIIDPLQDDIAPLFAPLFRAELEQPLTSSEHITTAAEQLNALGETAQLGRAPGATNLFLELDGQRQLLRYEGESFFTADQAFPMEALHDLLDRSPSRITPAAGLRPISQDFILPTAVLVGGPGELRYISQLKGVYAQHGVAMPLIWPRATLTLIEPPVKRILAKYQLSVSDVQQNLAQLENELLLQLSGYETRLEKKQLLIREAFDDIIETINSADPSLVTPSRKAKQHFERVLDKLQYKLARALSKQDDITTGQLERLRQHLLPEGVPQERLISPFSFFLKFGIEHTLKRVNQLSAQGEHSLNL